MDYRDIFVVLKGEGPGHPFRGNQYKAGSGGNAAKPKASKPKSAKSNSAKAKTAFIPLKSVRIQGATEDKSEWSDRGAYNAGIGKVQLSDGSEGVVKKCSEPGQAENEVLAAKVGSVLNAPIRDCVSLGGDDILMPLIEGQTFAEKDAKMVWADFFDALDPRIAAFDAVVGNYDRNVGNIIVTPDGQQVGIDHGAALENPADIWDVPDVTQFSKDPAKIQKMTEGLLALEPDFTSRGKGDVFQQMMANWYNGLVNAGMA